MTKKIAFALAAMSLVGGALAQEKDYKNAPFVGVSVGSAQIARTTQATYSRRTFSPTWTDTDPDNPLGGSSDVELVWSTETVSGKMEESPRGGYFGILAGYRYFVQPELAIRGYGELEYHPVKLVDYDDEDDAKASSKYINFIIGADALYYFKQDNDFDIAAFAGLGLALSHFDSKLLPESSKSAAGIMFNAGVHADIKQQHGVDIGFKIFSNKVNDNMNLAVDNVSVYADVTIKQKPSVFVRYTFSF